MRKVELSRAVIIKRCEREIRYPQAGLSSFRGYRRRFVSGYAATVQSDVWTHGSRPFGGGLVTRRRLSPALR